MKFPKVGESVHVFAAGFRCESGLQIAAHQVRGTIKAHHWVRPSEDDWGAPPDDEYETSVSWSLSETQEMESFTKDELHARWLGVVAPYGGQLVNRRARQAKACAGFFAFVFLGGIEIARCNSYTRSILVY